MKVIFNRLAIKASVGCVIRDNIGDWVCGCGGMIGLDMPFHAQLWRIYYGLKHVSEHNITYVVVECESAEATTQVSKNDPNEPIASLLQFINDLMKDD